MPPKDSIQLGPGQMYISTPEGLKPLGEVQEVEFTEEPELDIDGTIPSRIVQQPAEVTGTITLTAEASEAFKRVTEVLKKIINNFPNRRVVHLAKKHGDPLVRKKNRKRIARFRKKQARIKP